jgi:uncharacterized protein YceK
MVMKRILIALAIVSLNGCALVDSYLMTKYDPSEYRIIAEIRTEAKQYKTECANPLLSRPNAMAMADKTELFENYSEYIPRNTNVIAASKKLHEIAKGLVDSYNKPTPPSAAFCKIKFETIETNAATMQQIIGARPR